MIKINGVLKYNSQGDFELHTDGNEIVNISKILDKIYYDPDSNFTSVKIMEGCKILFNESSNLYLNKDDDGLYSYHICGENLEYVLFHNTGKVLEVIIRRKK